MKFKCSFEMDINDDSLLECINEWGENYNNRPYNNIEEVPEGKIYDIIYDAGYLDVTLDNITLGEVAVKKYEVSN